MTSLERKIKKAMQAEKNAFPQPSPSLQKRLHTLQPQRLKRVAWKTSLGFAATVILLAAICVKDQKQTAVEDNYFKPTQVVDLNDLNFEPTQTIYLKN